MESVRSKDERKLSDAKKHLADTRKREAKRKKRLADARKREAEEEAEANARRRRRTAERKLSDARRRGDKELENSIWNEARGKGKCPFRTNRGFSFDDERCLGCQERKGCKPDTQSRLLSILHGFQNNGNADPSPSKANREWFDDKRKSIREEANSIIKSQGVQTPGLHPNTQIYFQNCFPEWNEWITENLRKDMETFYELASNFDGYEPPTMDEEMELIKKGDWRGLDFPFEDLFDEEKLIPAKTRKQFARDYFSSSTFKIKTQRETAKRLGFFGKRKPREWPRRWMMDDKKLKKFIESKKGIFFIELLKYLEVTKMKKWEGEQVARDLGNGGKKFACVQVDRRKAARYLSRQLKLRGVVVSPLKVHRYLKWMSDNGLIKKLGQPGPRTNIVYAIGKWSAFPDMETGKMRPGRMSSFVRESNKKALVKAIKVKF